MLRLRGHTITTRPCTRMHTPVPPEGPVVPQAADVGLRRQHPVLLRAAGRAPDLAPRCLAVGRPPGVGVAPVGRHPRRHRRRASGICERTQRDDVKIEISPGASGCSGPRSARQTHRRRERRRAGGTAASKGTRGPGAWCPDPRPATCGGGPRWRRGETRRAESACGPRQTGPAGEAPRTGPCAAAGVSRREFRARRPARASRGRGVEEGAAGHSAARRVLQDARTHLGGLRVAGPLQVKQHEHVEIALVDLQGPGARTGATGACGKVGMLRRARSDGTRRRRHPPTIATQCFCFVTRPASGHLPRVVGAARRRMASQSHTRRAPCVAIPGRAARHHGHTRIADGPASSRAALGAEHRFLRRREMNMLVPGIACAGAERATHRVRWDGARSSGRVPRASVRGIRHALQAVPPRHPLPPARPPSARPRWGGPSPRLAT